MRRTGVRPALVMVAALGAAGWAGGSCRAPDPAPAPAAPACAPVEGGAMAGARAEVLAGEFRLTLAATRGPRAGSSTSGTLRLQPFGAAPAPVPATDGVRHPLFGGTSVRLDAVGAEAPGAVAPADPSRPGVLVMEWQRPGAPAGTPQVMLRLGADANEAGPPRFDGAFTALTVTALAPERFAGTWESGGGDAQAGGYFCADRIAGSD